MLPTKICTISIRHHLPVQIPGLHEVILRVCGFVPRGQPGNVDRRFHDGRIRPRTAEAVGVEIRITVAIRIAPHETVPLVCTGLRVLRAINRKLLVVGSETMAVGVVIGGQPALEQLIGGRSSIRTKFRTVPNAASSALRKTPRFRGVEIFVSSSVMLWQHYIFNIGVNPER